MTTDLFTSVFTCEQLKNLYSKEFRVVNGSAPTNIASLNRAKLVGLIEELRESARQHKRQHQHRQLN